MKRLFFCILLCCAATLYAQSYYRSGNYNRIGLNAKYALFNLDTDNFETEAKGGFLGGLTTRGRLYNNFGVVYGIDFLSTKIAVNGRPRGSVQEEDVEYDIIGAQINLLLSYHILEQNLTLEVGPALLVNGKMKLSDAGQEDNAISGFPLNSGIRAGDLQEISRINPFVVASITGGFSHVRFTVQYQYGLTNMLNGLNDQDLDNAPDFKGTASIISGGVILYL